jgi:hypothetical protein
LLVQKMTTDENRVRQTLMGFATEDLDHHKRDGEGDGLVASAESD